MSVEDQVSEIMSFLFKIDVCSVSDLNIESISEWDSMKHVALIAALENEFDLFIEVDDAVDLTSFTKIILYLKQ